ncbi:protein-tyrosine-phosphatase/RimJ/RimL family protein N-acetyltransferase [Marmoricola sp. OAE513]
MTAQNRPSVLFVCVHNAGRSQMAAGFLQHLAGDRVDVYSAGSQPADQINPVAVAAMAEEGIDIAGEQPKVLTESAVQKADVVITMGCGDECPFFPGKRYEDWQLDDPAGQGLESVRPIRDEIRRRVEVLIASLKNRVLLRRVESDDLDILFDDQADPEAAAMAGFPSRDRAQFDAHWAKLLADPTLVTRAIVVDGEVAGNIGSWIDEDLHLVGYWVGRDHWGRGVATSALRSFVAEVASRPLHAFVAAHNVGSIRVLEKAGFTCDEAGEDELRFVLRA